MKYGLKEETIRKINSVFSRYPQIYEAVLYGSRAKGNYKNGSDIDITLKGDKLDLSLVNRICLEIDDLLLPYSIDISIFNEITNPELVAHIKRVGAVFYQKPLPS